MNNQSGDDRATARGNRKAYWRVLGLSFLSGFGGGGVLVRHPDERIAATAQRWAAIGGTFMSIALGIDVLVRALVLRQDPRLYWDIGLIWLVTTLLVSIGQIRSGVQPFGAGRGQSLKPALLMVLIIALEVPLIMVLMGQVPSLRDYGVSALLAGASALVMVVVMRFIYRGWERRALGPDVSDE